MCIFVLLKIDFEFIVFDMMSSIAKMSSVAKIKGYILASHLGKEETAQV